MKVDAQDFLRLAEKSHSLAFVDIEATGLRADYCSTLVVSIKPYGLKPYSLTVNQVGNDIGVVMAAKKELEKYDAWVTFYGKGYDIPFLNTRLLKWLKAPIEKKPHVDMYYTLKYGTLLSRRSMAHMARFLKEGEQKQDVGPDVWAEIGSQPGAMKKMRARCESDVRVLEDLYNKTKHLIKDISR